MAKASRFRQSTLRRRRAFIDQRARFLLICEGRNSEPLYFRALGRNLKRIVIELMGGAGSPDTIAETAIGEARSRGYLGRRSGPAPADQVWAVFDRDQHEHFEDAVRACERNGIKVARSNPCFEVWLVLHIENFDRDCGRDEVFHHFCKLRPDYKDGKGRECDFATLVQSVQLAEERAVRQLAARQAEGVPFGPPSTTVFELTSVLRTRG
jgi:hypothetical protein